MLKKIIYLIFLTPLLGLIYNPFSFLKPSIKNKDITKNINYNKDYEDTINKLNVFFGVIGPNIDRSNIKTLYELLMGNGIINGIFISNGNITFVKKFIKTDKFIRDELIRSFDILELIKYQKQKRNIIFPNILGVANTALYKIKDKLYALHERDLPYLLNINFTSKDIETVKRIEIKDVNYFSAHSKYNNSIIETIDYKLLEKKVIYYQLTENFNIISEQKIRMKNYPLIHDFISTEESILILDSPLKINYKSFLSNKNIIPIILDKNSPTYLYVYNKKKNKLTETYTIYDGFYVFHFADYYEDDTYIEIYASLYDKLDFSSLKLQGKYRRIKINKLTKKVDIDKNIELENMNLDFPIKYNNKIILQNSLEEFIICEKLNIIKKLRITKGKINGEHQIVYIDNVAYLICFSSYDRSSSIIIINLENDDIMEIPIEEDLNVGFHSIYINNSL